MKIFREFHNSTDFKDGDLNTFLGKNRRQIFLKGQNQAPTSRSKDYRYAKQAQNEKINLASKIEVSKFHTDKDIVRDKE